MKLMKHQHLLWSRFRQWLSKHRKIAWAVGGIVIICIGGLTVFMILFHEPAVAVKKSVVRSVVKSKSIPKPVKYYSPLTGSLVANQAATQQTVTAVMIENSPDARPQSGLKDSGVVFEAIAEGGITRFLVIYQSEKPQLIGPVRSLRLYDVDWLAAFGAGIAHVGGSAAALSEIRNGSYHDLDQFFNPGSFWRSTDRWAPHNVYTSFEKLDALNAAKGYITANFTGFSRTDGSPSATPNATNINVTISSYLYNSSYAYDKTTNTYARSQAGEAHLDRESGQITPSVVIAMRVDETTVLEDGYRENISTIGSGNATIFQNGIAISATWNKSSKTSQINFTDANGQDIPLTRGQTWIAAVPNDEGDVTWQ